jgi:exodeoxyribonuclease VII small subunit
MSPPETETARVAEFEASLDELELLVSRMEKGDMPLDESLAAFERGVGLYRQCRTALDAAELRVRQIIDPNDLDGAPPFVPDTP